MKKVFKKISVLTVITLAATFFFPYEANKLLLYAGKIITKYLLFLNRVFKMVMPGEILSTRMVFLFHLIIFALIIIVFTFSKIKKNRNKKIVSPKKPVIKPEVSVASVVKEEPRPEEDEGYDSTRDIVVNFFLNIYKIQLGALKSAPGKFKPVKAINMWPNNVYELSVYHDGDWVSRRLTIGPLGDDGVSKSVCYYVIYDDHLVVKIPPEPITDFQEYLSCIKADMKIARKLAPKECIIPKVSVILGRLISDGTQKHDSKTIEKSYIERLSSNSKFQEYLKIGDSFVFFMDLARYYFLSRVLQEMHDIEDTLPREILGHPHIIWDTHEFEGRYGRGNSHLGFEMRNIYEEYEREISRLLIQYGVSSNLPTYSMKTWFLVHLSGKGSVEAGEDLSESFIEDLNALSRESMIDNRVSIEAYRKVVREYIYKITIAKYKAEMASIITNLIGLLVWLGHRQIALRDLKPDNLLIAGDPERYPQFLRSTDQYSMGFIDVETAVDYGFESITDIEQPQLGGTPKYATPSHLFPNELIVAVYEDLKRILHLQDWYAAVAMIYKVVTGGTLFEKTAILLPEIKRILESPVDDSGQLVSITEYVSKLFWKSASDELYEKIGKNRIILNSVKVIVLDKDKRVLIREVAKERKSLSKLILSRIKAQVYFKGNKNRVQIFNSSSKRIAALRKKRQNDDGNPTSANKGVIQFLREIEYLKIQLEQRNMAIEYLKSSKTEIPVATIMEVMFNIVLTVMYTEVWGELLDANFEAGDESDDAASYEATI